MTSMRALLNKREAAAPPLSNAIIISYDIRSSVTFFFTLSSFLPSFFPHRHRCYCTVASLLLPLLSRSRYYIPLQRARREKR